MSTDIVVLYIKYILHTSKKEQFTSGSWLRSAPKSQRQPLEWKYTLYINSPKWKTFIC